MPTITKKMEPYNITGFSPIDITGLDLWLDGNDPSTMYNASNGGANVSHNGYVWRWEDKSRNANHVYTMTGVPGNFTQPQYYENLTNYKGGLTFSNSVLTNLVQAPYPVDVYIVLSLCNYNNIGISGLTRTNMNVFSVKYPGGTFGSNKDWNGLAYGLMNSGQGINYSNKWVNNSSNYIRTPNTVPTEGETSMGFLLLNWGISNSDYRIKRYTTTLAETNTYTTWATYANSNTAFRYFIGGIDYSANDSNFTGSICEILSFSNLLNLSNRTVVESYLANKWGLQKNIPVTHPGRLGNFPSLIGYSLSTIDGVRGYDKRGVANLVYVQAPQSPTITTSQILMGGDFFAISWSPNGGTADYYLVTIQQSINNSTWTIVAYNSRYTITDYNHQIGSVDNKYYRAIIESKNSGGSASTTSDSLLNSVPAPPSPSAPNFVSTGVVMTWTPVFPGGIPASYTVYLYENDILIDTFSSVTDTTYTSTTILTMLAVYKFKVSATNSIGTSSDSVFSSAVQYNGAGA
jgi:hypothetical protein